MKERIVGLIAAHIILFILLLAKKHGDTSFMIALGMTIIIWILLDRDIKRK